MDKIKACSKCGKILQKIKIINGEEKIESFEIMWYQVKLLYFCQECYKEERD